MQHYELPTRLLDITTNSLVALFFACSNNKDINAEIYIFKVKNEDIIEKENPKQLKGVLNKVYTRAPLDPQTLGEIVKTIGSIQLYNKNDEMDILGKVYEYFLGKFAQQEGKGGEFFTPDSVVRLLVEMIEPLNGRVYDGCCGSGGMKDEIP